MSQLPAWREGTPEFLVAQVLSHPRLLLMTDYDGTLVPVRERPEFALPGPGLLKVLKRLAKKSRVVLAVVSGRDTGELKKLIPVERIYLAGCHGAEILYPGGEKFTAVDEKKLAPLLDLAAGRARSCISGEEGFLVERKKTAVALHYRLAGPVTALKVLSNFVTAVRPLVMKHNLEFMSGKKVIEVRPRGVNKGEAVRRLINLHPDCYPVYLGDDTTDEDAFGAVREKGLGVLVSEHKKFTAASHWLRDPRDVLRFLQIIAARC